MADISKIKLPTGTTYDLKDAQARSDIERIEELIVGGTHFLGVTTTPLTEGATTNPITIDGKSVTAVSGDIVIYQSLEFIFSDYDNKWHEFGSTGELGDLAFKDSASGTYTPSGSVSQPTFTGTQGSVSVSGTPSGSVTISTAASGTANYTPAGSVSQPTFSGTAFTSTGNFTPEGSVSTPTITVTPNTTTVNSITGVGSLPDFGATVANETLTLSWDAGALPTRGANTTVATGIKSATSTQPTFTGTQGSVSVSGTATGTVSKPTFTGTGAKLEGTFSGNVLNSTGNFTPSGTVSKPSFTGTEATITVS